MHELSKKHLVDQTGSMGISLSIPVHQGVRLFPKLPFYAHVSLFHLCHNI